MSEVDLLIEIDHAMMCGDDERVKRLMATLSSRVSKPKLRLVEVPSDD